MKGFLDNKDRVAKKFFVKSFVDGKINGKF